MSLTLVRHTPLLDVEGLCYGASEVGIKPGFEADAEAMISELRQPDRIVASPLGRCRLLAEFVGRRLEMPVAIDARWSEMDFGAWEGRRWDKITRVEVDTWAEDFMNARPHGGESVATLLARVRSALATARSLGGHALIVTHKGPIRAALVADGDETAWTRDIPFGELVELDGKLAQIERATP